MSREAYLIRNQQTGRMATVMAFSCRGAVKIYAAKYGKVGKVEVKLRGSSEDWEIYSIS